jgi:hypothetical protein
MMWLVVLFTSIKKNNKLAGTELHKNQDAPGMWQVLIGLSYYVWDHSSKQQLLSYDVWSMNTTLWDQEFKNLLPLYTTRMPIYFLHLRGDAGSPAAA